MKVMIGIENKETEPEWVDREATWKELRGKKKIATCKSLLLEDVDKDTCKYLDIVSL